MREILINLSPRVDGTSHMLMEYFSERMESEGHITEQVNLYQQQKSLDVLMEQIKVADTIVMIGPCYVDSYPALVIALLTKMADTDGVLHGQSLYGFIQGGMPYVHTHEHGIKLLENFAAHEKVEFKGGFVMGGGAILNGQSLDHIIGAKKMVPAVNEFILHIIKNESSPSGLYMDAAKKIPAIVTRLIVAFMNHSIKKDFKSRKIDFKGKGRT